MPLSLLLSLLVPAHVHAKIQAASPNKAAVRQATSSVLSLLARHAPEDDIQAGLALLTPAEIVCVAYMMLWMQQTTANVTVKIRDNVQAQLATTTANVAQIEQRVDVMNMWLATNEDPYNIHWRVVEWLRQEITQDLDRAMDTVEQSEIDYEMAQQGVEEIGQERARLFEVLELLRMHLLMRE
ncbi:hypothetical protein GGF32_001133 [Allomyces javanicus]|nr:hypothetical protein GGF32_001133 [Allomyces javanicus]